MTALEHEPAPVELDRTTVALVQGCRYRYATGCGATYRAAQKQGLYAHEKSTAAHALHRVTLRDCPECGAGCGDEIKRGMHLKVEHGIRAGSEKRQELDAVQVKAILEATARPDDALSPAAQVPVPDDAQQPNRPLLDRPRLSGVFEPDGHPDLAPWANGHSPAALDLSAARDMFAALIAEVERLRASLAVDPHVAEDASRYRQMKAIVAAQD
jgi:hypothetical protein